MQNNISSVVMLARVEFGLPRQSVALPEEATKIEENKGAETGTVTASAHYFKRKGKKELGEPKIVDGLIDLRDFQREFRDAVYHRARYEHIGGFRLCPANLVDELIEVKKSMETKGEEVWFKWADNVYPMWYETAQARMGALFNQSDFPSLEDCQKRFTFECAIVPMAEAEQLKHITLISPNSAAVIAKGIEEGTKKSIEAAHVSIWSDLMAPLAKIEEVMSKDKAKIYETLLENLMSVVNIIPSYGALINDSKLMEAANKAKEVFGALKTEDLKKSDDARKLALAAAKDIQLSFAPFVRKFA